MADEKMRWRGGCKAIAVAAGFAVVSIATTALAHDGEGHWHHHHHHHHVPPGHVYYYGGPVVYAPPVVYRAYRAPVYVPPPVVYAPAPEYYGPPPGLNINLNMPLR
jgi:hypothetical protein